LTDPKGLKGTGGNPDFLDILDFFLRHIVGWVAYQPTHPTLLSDFPSHILISCLVKDLMVDFFIICYDYLTLDVLMKRIRDAIELSLEVEEPVSNEFVGVKRVN